MDSTQPSNESVQGAPEGVHGQKNKIRKTLRKWTVTDFLVASVVSLACGILFLVFNLGYSLFSFLSLAYPPLIGLYSGIWVLAGVLVMMMIQKPGAALYGGCVAAVISMILGSGYGVEAVWSGIIQGGCAEIIFALFFYKRFSLLVAMLAGAAGGVGIGLYAILVSSMMAWNDMSKIVYLIFVTISGAFLAGGGSWLIVRFLQKTGVLNKLNSGKNGLQLV